MHLKPQSPSVRRAARLSSNQHRFNQECGTASMHQTAAAPTARATRSAPQLGRSSENELPESLFISTGARNGRLYGGGRKKVNTNGRHASSIFFGSEPSAFSRDKVKTRQPPVVSMKPQRYITTDIFSGGGDGSPTRRLGKGLVGPRKTTSELLTGTGKQLMPPRRKIPQDYTSYPTSVAAKNHPRLAGFFKMLDRGSQRRALLASKLRQQGIDPSLLDTPERLVPLQGALPAPKMIASSRIMNDDNRSSPLFHSHHQHYHSRDDGHSRPAQTYSAMMSHDSSHDSRGYSSGAVSELQRLREAAQHQRDFRTETRQQALLSGVEDERRVECERRQLESEYMDQLRAEGNYSRLRSLLTEKKKHDRRSKGPHAAALKPTAPQKGNRRRPNRGGSGMGHDKCSISIGGLAAVGKQALYWDRKW